jgi:hypothetical protein
MQRLLPHKTPPPGLRRGRTCCLCSIRSDTTRRHIHTHPHGTPGSTCISCTWFRPPRTPCRTTRCIGRRCSTRYSSHPRMCTCLRCTNCLLHRIRTRFHPHRKALPIGSTPRRTCLRCSIRRGTSSRRKRTSLPCHMSVRWRTANTQHLRRRTPRLFGPDTRRTRRRCSIRWDTTPGRIRRPRERCTLAREGTRRTPARRRELAPHRPCHQPHLRLRL